MHSRCRSEYARRMFAVARPIVNAIQLHQQIRIPYIGLKFQTTCQESAVGSQHGSVRMIENVAADPSRDMIPSRRLQRFQDKG
jgi:hypothetical protein